MAFCILVILNPKYLSDKCKIVNILNNNTYLSTVLLTRHFRYFHQIEKFKQNNLSRLLTTYERWRNDIWLLISQRLATIGIRIKTINLN